MARKSRKHEKRAARRADRRAAALAAAAASAPAADVEPTRQHPAVVHEPAPPVAAEPTPTVESRPPEPSRRSARRTALALALAALIGAALIGAVLLQDGMTDLAASPSTPASVEVGIPGGEVVNDSTPTPAPTPTERPEPSPTDPPPTDAPPTQAPATPAPTSEPVAEATPEPTAAPTAAPVAAPPAPPAPQPSSVVAAAVASPADAVAAFYRRVADGDFDAAYALWSDRMKATYPRQENLDERFASTASITFSQLYVADQTATTATVQANFTETYDGGSSREFVGYWRLIRTTRGWLLDEPHY